MWQVEVALVPLGPGHGLSMYTYVRTSPGMLGIYNLTYLDDIIKPDGLLKYIITNHRCLFARHLLGVNPGVKIRNLACWG